MMPSSKQIVLDPIAIGLQALAWTVGEQARADRMLALTGLAGPDLRDRATDPAVLAAVLGFLEAFEPDLLACADAIGVAPAVLVAAREMLER